MDHIKQLDSIRAMAVLLVIITHWFPEGHWLNSYTSVFNGVDIFFVLSGFLITTILLLHRNEAERIGTSKLTVFRNFFTRRALRIFPIYYLTLAVLYLLGPLTESGIRDNYLYFFTYTSNLYFFEQQQWDGMLSHLWSLAVEEQFYLVWPWVMLYLNKPYLLPFIVISILIGITSQLFLLNQDFGDILTFACFDAFGLGALLAWVRVYQPSLLPKLFKYSLALALLCFALQISRVMGQSSYLVLPSRTLTAVCTLSVIAGIILYKDRQLPVLSKVLGNSSLLFIGKISYGFYLYHLMIPYFSYELLGRVNAYFWPLGSELFIFYLVRLENFCLLILLSALSWRLLEHPILRFKTYFEYQNEKLYQPKKILL
ncbi:peptidoglycan/LPS O-acetylase OafA/YrhL [Pontibacter mucosus]|uniref:Peptidoglycan/LPS O-acetylase OafA/YrhL n=1 Tax=Pontibacter mucosus TaxID=1649266 RepID=A0A2T5YCP9_9BACT|nr:acyltransferase [Pontibacter mucosus]PTX14231.1 peptidoglycan/LPS O-acetylase OafA/YrhL [Pontibacter mucosus]